MQPQWDALSQVVFVSLRSDCHMLVNLCFRLWHLFEGLKVAMHFWRPNQPNLEKELKPKQLVVGEDCPGGPNNAFLISRVNFCNLTSKTLGLLLLRNKHEYKSDQVNEREGACRRTEER